MAKDMTALIDALNEASKSGSENPVEQKGKIFTAKNITLVVLIVAFAFGVYGSFEKALFQMDEYVKFLETFTWFFAPLVVSIGAGTATKLITDKSKKEKDPVEGK